MAQEIEAGGALVQRLREIVAGDLPSFGDGRPVDEGRHVRQVIEQLLLIAQLGVDDVQRAGPCRGIRRRRRGGGGMPQVAQKHGCQPRDVGDIEEAQLVVEKQQSPGHGCGLGRRSNPHDEPRAGIMALPDLRAELGGQKSPRQSPHDPCLGCRDGEAAAEALPQRCLVNALREDCLESRSCFVQTFGLCDARREQRLRPAPGYPPTIHPVADDLDRVRHRFCHPCHLPSAFDGARLTP